MLILIVSLLGEVAKTDDALRLQLVEAFDDAPANEGNHPDQQP